MPCVDKPFTIEVLVTKDFLVTAAMEKFVFLDSVWLIGLIVTNCQRFCHEWLRTVLQG
jgi:hypothetical protein